MCHHHPQCPSAQASDRLAAHIVAPHPEQGWSLLCNGVVAFDDNGALLPDGGVIDRGQKRGLRLALPRDTSHREAQIRDMLPLQQ